MPVIENIKNLLRHGKQARHNDPATKSRNAHSDPLIGTINAPKAHRRVDDYTVAEGADHKNIVAQAEGKMAHAAGTHQKLDDESDVIPGGHGIGVSAGGITGAKQGTGKIDDSVLARIVAEEKASKGKLPNYPGLERFTLLEKMGDGAFSNVYRARDNTGEHGEVAIKVVRKYELNSNQDQHLHPSLKKLPKTVEVS
ncbi:hypothetical protein DFH27DRAFT_220117 [Peziza echinospora]|nr:hypothetical protein DFH27DRAFT_220117 [Peziza echinospora]